VPVSARVVKYVKVLPILTNLESLMEYVIMSPSTSLAFAEIRTMSVATASILAMGWRTGASSTGVTMRVTLFETAEARAVSRAVKAIDLVPKKFFCGERVTILPEMDTLIFAGRVLVNVRTSPLSMSPK